MPRLVVIAGPANSGKMPLAQELVAGHAGPVLIHRDLVRHALVNSIDEWHITLTTAAMARILLTLGHHVVAVGWNLEPRDRKLWEGVAIETDAKLEWLDTRDPAVHRMIPPLKGFVPATF